MSTRTQVDSGRSQRDELERLQEELRETRCQRETLPRENAELAEQVDRLEQEVRWLSRMAEVAQAEAERPASSLPDQLVLPFRATPSRRTAYGRLRYALKMLPSSVAIFLYFGSSVIGSLHRLATYGGLLLLCLALLYVLQGPEDDDDVQSAWGFDEEGLSLEGTEALKGKILYSEIQSVEVRQGWLQRLFGFGSVRIIWKPGVPTSIGKAVNYPNRTVDIDMLDDPRRLAEWLRERARLPKEAAHVG
ncbi:PH domain-containing protein [Hyalangium minutum]|uniref:YdbS-like PH domain-containing protein n=1 Tax=Hyalangium minutum TaxID=394096 RepID=A0A085W4D3_9BACT|nr:PH domain-containing protein [Hyalangium minutum]KFE62546.1 hypothetical protein DB31_3980 [Hyalangium minutum]